MPIHTLLTTAGALLLVLGLIGVAAALLRRLRPGPPEAADALAITASLALDPRRRLHLIACQGRHVLLLTGGGTDVVLGWLPAEGTP